MSGAGERGSGGMVTLGALAVVLALLAGGWGWATWTNSSKDAALREVLDQFAAPAGWAQVKETVEPARVLCLDANPCPYAQLEWEGGTPLDPQQFAALVGAAGWDLRVSGDCQPSTNTSGFVGVCEANGRVEEFDVRLVQERSSQQPQARLVLVVRPAGE